MTVSNMAKESRRRKAGAISCAQLSLRLILRLCCATTRTPEVVDCPKAATFEQMWDCSICTVCASFCSADISSLSWRPVAPHARIEPLLFLSSPQPFSDSSDFSCRLITIAVLSPILLLSVGSTSHRILRESLACPSELFECQRDPIPILQVANILG